MLDYVALLVSVTFFLFFVLSVNSINRIDFLVFVFFVPLYFSLSILFVVADFFTGRGVDDSVIYHLRYGLGGAGFGEYWELISISVLGFCFSFLFVYMLKNNYFGLNFLRNSNNIKAYFLLLFSFVFSPAVLGYFELFESQIYADKKNSLTEYDYYGYYRAPAIKHAPSMKKNIVYIYAESLERSYLDDSKFPGLMKNIREIESRSKSFTNIEQVAGTGWTIAGLTATQCGIPLQSPSGGNSMSGMDVFLPNAICLGDILSNAGYQLHYLSGSSIDFAGTEKLFSTHGFDEVDGIEEISKSFNFDNYRNSWGAYDDTLLDIAFEKFNKLQNNGLPFALFLSTMDTHHPKGHMSAGCNNAKYRDGKNLMLNAVMCSDMLISEFIDKILTSDYAKNTVVVLSSDHLAMRNTATDILNKIERRNLFLVMDSEAVGVKNNKRGSMLDVTPTLLSILGYDIDFGLGRNLLSEEASLVSLFPDFNQVLKGWSTQLMKFWGFPEIESKDDFLLNYKNKTLSISGRVFRYPIIVEILKNKSTILKFDSQEQGQRLVDYHRLIKVGMPFIWIDKCKVLEPLVVYRWGDYCVEYGEAGTSNIKISILDMKANKELHVFLKDVLDNTRHRTNDEIEDNSQDVSRFIAHAGGEVDGHKYTNSLEALNKSYKNGFKLFELDIIVTSDGEYVAAHDWIHWRRQSGYEGKLPPTKEEFNSYKILGQYTAMDMERINQWFKNHSDAILVTDKVNKPLDFSNGFVDKSRLMMELFSWSAVRQGLDSGIRSSMPTWDILAELKGDKIEKLLELGVTQISASRRVLNNNYRFINELSDNGIDIYVFHVNFDEGRDESYVICKDMDYIFGMYADKYDFAEKINCENISDTNGY